MDVIFQEVADQELARVFAMIDACGIERDTFTEHAQSCVLGYRWDEHETAATDEVDDSGFRGVTVAEELGLPAIEVEKHIANFSFICSGVPHIPQRALCFLGHAYSNLIAVRDGAAGFDSPQRRLEGLAHGSYVTGKAEGVLELQLVEHRRKANLTNAGSKGAEVKHEATRKLKLWAVNNARQLRGADMDIARKLAARVPTELADASKNPQRLIYDAIRAGRKPPST